MREFLESSTIHGLVYISTSKAVLVKFLWFVIVAIGFSVSGVLIYQSFIDWNTSPVGTSEETLTIAEVHFPKVTVCPPRGSHTALNYYLEQAGSLQLNED